MTLFDQRGQHVTVQWSEAFIDRAKATAIFLVHRDRYQAAREKAQADGDVQRAERYDSRLAALRAFALEIGIEEA